MGREMRMVPPDWQHPKDSSGHFIPLLKKSYEEALARYKEEKAKFSEGIVETYEDGRFVWAPIKPEYKDVTFEEYTGWKSEPDPDRYMPVFPPGTATYFQMYETCSEGTPISPAFSSIEELARWLADTGASAFASLTASYEGWLATCKRGYTAGDFFLVGGSALTGVEMNRLSKGGSGDAESK